MAWRTPVAGWCAFRHEMAGRKAWRIPLNLHGRIFIALSLMASQRDYGDCGVQVAALMELQRDYGD